LVPHNDYLAWQRCRFDNHFVSWKEVDEGWIRFDPHSGTTHLLSPLARFVIELIERSPIVFSSSDIVEKVLLVEPDADPADSLVEVESILQILSEAKLIETYRLDRQRPDSY